MVTGIHVLLILLLPEIKQDIIVASQAAEVFLYMLDTGSPWKCVFSKCNRVDSVVCKT